MKFFGILSAFVFAAVVVAAPADDKVEKQQV